MHGAELHLCINALMHCKIYPGPKCNELIVQIILQCFCLLTVHVPTSILDYSLVDCFILLLTVVQEGWCDSVGSVQEIQAKLLKRQEAAAKRERAMAYALAHQVKHDISLC